VPPFTGASMSALGYPEQTSSPETASLGRFCAFNQTGNQVLERPIYPGKRVLAYAAARAEVVTVRLSPKTLVLASSLG
jgi:hypothetical protein